MTENTQLLRFVYQVLWSDEDGEYVGTCSEFPGLSHLDADPDAALEGICALVDDILKFKN